MLLHHLRIFFRYFLRNTAYHSLNVLGLAFGISVSLLIMFWLWDELSFDKFHINGAKIYRLVNGTPGDEEAWVGTPARLAPELMANYPEIESFVRIDHKESVVRYGEKIMNETGILLADSNFFSMFSYELIIGSKEDVLRDINSIVLTQKSAIKYFGEEDPINEIVLLDDEPYTVSGLAKDPPHNTYHQFDFVIRFEKINKNLYDYNYMDCWGCWNFESYLLLKDKVEPPFLESKIRDFFVIHDDQRREFKDLSLQPMEDIHFEYIRGNVQPEFQIKYIYLYSSLAIIVLILAIINNINLTVVIAPIRSKEIGLKKIMGAGRKGLIYLIMFETFMSTLISFLIAMTFTLMFMPVLENLTGRQIIINYQDPVLWILFGGIIFLTTIASGIYPAIILSNYSAVSIVKGIFQGRRKATFRNILVILQFVISISFIIGTLTFTKQLYYIRNKNLGFSKDQVLNIRIFTNEIKDKNEIEAFYSKIDALKYELSSLQNVLISSNNNFNPANMNRRHGILWEGKKDDEQLSMFILSGDKYMIPMLGLELIEGEEKVKNFERKETDAYILNQSAMEALNWESYDGKFFSIFGEGRSGEVIGICKNFHYRSLHHVIGPCVIILSEYGSQISLKLQSSNYAENIDAVKRIYSKVFPNSPFEYYFLDQQFDKLYKSEIRMSRLVSYLTIVSIIIACLGIFGLSSYMTIQRTKEIGIRKVMGSSASKIIYMLTSDVVRWVIVSFIISVPLTYYFLKQWLENFAYKTPLSWWIFMLGAITVSLIALLTVIYQAVKAALKNPTEALRYE